MLVIHSRVGSDCADYHIAIVFRTPRGEVERTSFSTTYEKGDQTIDRAQQFGYFGCSGVTCISSGSRKDLANWWLGLVR
jgi:hypothetical protein